jgi:hypothetical protein
MKSYELIGEVDEHHQVHVQVPNNWEPGRVHIRLVREDEEQKMESGDLGEDPTIQDLSEWISQFAVDTGIEGLAHQHDHYIHGTPKTPK